MDQMGEVDYAPGEPRGHRLAPAPRLRDRHLHHRRHVPAPGLPRRRRRDHRRRHAVDDRRRRASSTSRRRPRSSSSAAACSTASSCGSTCRSTDKMVAPRYQNLEADAVGAAVLARRRRARAAHRRRRRRPRRARLRRTRRSPSPTPPSPPGARLVLPWRPDFNALAYVLAGRGTRRGGAAPGRGRPARRVRRRRLAHASTAAGTDRSRCCCSAGADPRARRRVRPVRDEHPGRAGPGRRGLPGRPPGPDPRRRPAPLPPAPVRTYWRCSTAPRWCCSGWPTAAIRTS